MITAAQKLPAGTVYAIFVGLGTAGTVVAGIFLFGESFKWVKVILITTLLVGVMDLKLRLGTVPHLGQCEGDGAVYTTKKR